MPVLQTQQQQQGIVTTGNVINQNATSANTNSFNNSVISQNNNNQCVQAVSLSNLSQLNFASLTNQNQNIQQLNRNNANTNSNANSNNNSNNNNGANNGTTPIKTLLEDDDKSDNDMDDQGPTIANIPSHHNQNNQNSQNSIPTGHVTHATTVDGVNLDEIREFAKAFKLRRLALGLTQTQVGQALSATKGPAYSQSAICRFEKLDITPKSAAKIKPVLEKWMQEAELKYADRLKSGNHQNFADLLGTESSKKRKRRTSFTPQALEILNEYFEKNTHPSGIVIVLFLFDQFLK